MCFESGKQYLDPDHAAEVVRAFIREHGIANPSPELSVLLAVVKPWDRLTCCWRNFPRVR